MVTQPSVEELIGALPGVAFLLDQADRVLHANAAAAALLGRPEDAVRDAIEGAGAPAALLAAARTARAGTRTVVVVALADGAPCECTAMAVGTGAVLIVGHAVSASSEVTGRWQPAPTAAEAQLLQLQAPGTVGRLVSDVAHDFNNLLTAVLGESEIALARSHEADTVLGLKNIRTAALQGRRLTAQLLAFARQEKLQVETVEVAELLAVMTPLLTRLLGEDVGLAIACAPDLWPVRVEPTQIEQVLMNLAVNARNAMPDGGHLEISAGNWRGDPSRPDAPADAFVQLSIADDGVGMDATTMRRMFEPFFSNRPGGLGLGLAICHDIITQHDGRIWATSASGRGTTFHVLLPRSMAVLVPQAAVARAAATARSGTILLAEHDDLVRQVAERALREQGFVVLSAGDGAAAAELAAAHPGPIDVLVTNVVMPQGSGFELARWLRPQRPQLRVLLVADHLAGPAPALDAAVLQKPYTPSELAAAVRALLTAAHESMGKQG